MKKNIHYILILCSSLLYLVFNIFSLSVLWIIILLISNSFLYLLLIRHLTYNDIKYSIYVIFLAGLAFRLMLIFNGPMLSDDVYRYIWDGKVQYHNTDPYRFAPVDKNLKYLSNETFPKMINHPHMKTVYPPLAQKIFYFSYYMFGESITGFKFFLLFADIFTFFIAVKILKQLKLNTSLVSVYFLSPLVIFHFFVDAHLDALGFPFFLAAIFLLLKHRQFLSSFFIGIAAGVKLLPLIFIPAFLTTTKRFLKKIPLFLIPILVIVVFYIPYLGSGTYPFESFLKYMTDFYFNGSAYNFFSLFFSGKTVRIICFFCFMFSILIIMFRGKEFKRKLFFLIFSFLIFAPVVHPWYLTWLCLSMVFYSQTSGLIFIIVINFSLWVYSDFLTKGIWEENTFILLMQYIPVFLILIIEWIKPKKIRLIKYN